jgi:hypothetical protein
VIILHIHYSLPAQIAHISTYRPVESFWTWPPPANLKCLSPKVVVFASGVIKVFIDIMITSLPIPLILRLNMSPPRKRAVIVLLGLGYIVTAAGAIRTYYAYYIVWRTYDETWYNYYGFVAATIENDLAIVCACAPALRPLMQRLVPGWGTRMSSYLTSFRTKWSKSTISGQSKTGRSTSKQDAFLFDATDISKGTKSMSVSQSMSMSQTQSTTHHMDTNYGGRTFWLTTINKSDEDLPGITQQQDEHDEHDQHDEQIEWPLRPNDIEMRAQSSGNVFTPVENSQGVVTEAQRPMSRREIRESTFRTWRIENNPLQGANDPYQNQQNNSWN